MYVKPNTNRYYSRSVDSTQFNFQHMPIQYLRKQGIIFTTRISLATRENFPSIMFSFEFEILLFFIYISHLYFALCPHVCILLPFLYLYPFYNTFPYLFTIKFSISSFLTATLMFSFISVAAPFLDRTTNPRITIMSWVYTYKLSILMMSWYVWLESGRNFMMSHSHNI